MAPPIDEGTALQFNSVDGSEGGCAWFCPLALGEIFASGELVDVVLRPLEATARDDAKPLRVHSLVLALASPVLRKMIQWERERTTRAEEGGAVILQLDASAATLECFVSYVYQGRTLVRGDAAELLSLGRLADQLDVQSLRNAVLAQARDMLTADTCTLFLNAGRHEGLPELEEIAMGFALRHLRSVRPFLSLQLSRPKPVPDSTSPRSASLDLNLWKLPVRSVREAPCVRGAFGIRAKG